MLSKNILLIISILFFFSIETYSQFYVGDIILDKREVFDSTRDDWFFAAPLINSLHTSTKDYLIGDEVLFNSGDTFNMDLIDETERNLRNIGLFSDVLIYLDSSSEDTYDVTILTHEKWSTMPSILFGTGGGEVNYGFRMEETNLAGHGFVLSAEALNRSENDIGWQGEILLSHRRFARTNFALNLGLKANEYRTDQNLLLFDPYRNLHDEYSFGLKVRNAFGRDILYNYTDSLRLMPFHDRNTQFWYSMAWNRGNRFFFTILTEYDDVDRVFDFYKRAYDNSGKVLITFSSVEQDFVTTNKLNNYLTEDLVVGGYGSATLGKIFPIGSKGESLFYLGGQGERSYYDGTMYLFGKIRAGSAFLDGRSLYTFQGFTGLGFYRITDDLLLAARVDQQTTWNWFKLRQLILDNDFGLRGYEANSLAGDNRIISNWEIRHFNNIHWWIFDLSTVLFYDIGASWNQHQKITETKFYSSLGLGIRFHNSKMRGENSIFRIDFAFNLNDNKFGSIIFTTDQLFSVFSNHDFQLPEIFGLEFDYE